MTAPHILVVDDERDIRELLSEILVEEGYAVSVAADADAAKATADASPPDLVLLDIWMPDVDGITLLKAWRDGGAEPPFPVIMISGHGTIETAVEATRFGAYDYVEKPLSLAKLLLTIRAALGADEQHHAEPATRLPADERVELVGTSREIVSLRERVARMGQADVDALLRGEGGAGKRTTARLIHEASARADGPFVVAEPGAVGGVHSALFDADGPYGHAAGGTLAIDDLAELDAAGQARLAACLEANRAAEGPRVVAVTALDPAAAVDAGDLRADLFHALNSAPVFVPPLRAHAEDVPELLGYWTERLVAAEGRTYRHFSVAAQNRLRHYRWPGNVAELVSLVRQVLATGAGVEVDVDEIERALSHIRPEVEQGMTAVPLPLDLPLREARQVFERVYLQRQLQAVGGRMGELAQRVGMERTHLYRKLRSLGIGHGSRERG